jgi:hypothetical protein
MISSVTGEIAFLDGLQFGPHMVLSPALIASACDHGSLPIAGWCQYALGLHASDHGDFNVEVVCNGARRVQAVLLAHSHHFYEANTPNDSERHAFHEGVIASDLMGQLEFPWGEVICRFDKRCHKDWLVVVYTTGPQVPLQKAELLRHLYEHEAEPKNA